MSQLKTTKVYLGDSATLANNFQISVPATPDGSLTIERGDGTDVLTVDASGVVAPTSGQIKFPATQNASADVNTLDDYEEGTWTPNQGAGLTVVGAFGSSGYYTKIGRLVTAVMVVSGATSVAVTAGGIVSTNLPFTVLATSVGSGANATGTALINVTVGGTDTSVYAITAMTATANITITVTYFV